MIKADPLLLFEGRHAEVCYISRNFHCCISTGLTTVLTSNDTQNNKKRIVSVSRLTFIRRWATFDINWSYFIEEALQEIGTKFFEISPLSHISSVVLGLKITFVSPRFYRETTMSWTCVAWYVVLIMYLSSWAICSPHALLSEWLLSVVMTPFII